MSIEQIREALQAIPRLSAAATGSAPTQDEIYYPGGHATALDPETSLVVGNRGMGKSFWANALYHPATRTEIAQRYLGARAMKLERVDVDFGFASGEAAIGKVSRDDLARVNERVPTETIWRAVLVRVFAQYANTHIPDNFNTLVRWVSDNPQAHRDIFQRADSDLSRNGRTKLIVFDQLEQMADDWQRIQNLTQGILKTCLSVKSYNSIRIKVFIRPDQFDDGSLFRFPDASKIKGEATTLKWRSIDLYGLLFHRLYIDNRSKASLCRMVSEFGGDPTAIHRRLRIPTFLVASEQNQALVFDEIAGNAMGGGKKRGRPYSWIPTHLADGRGEISPRTFLTAIRTAADHTDPPPDATAIDFHGIQEGVRAASENRLTELSEDYPWVSEVLKPLRKLIVPCLPEEISDMWASDNTISRISAFYKGVSAPIELIIPEMFDEPDLVKAHHLLNVLREIGVVEVRENGKINFPDIFRVQSGMKRRGGVTPQQRRQL